MWNYTNLSIKKIPKITLNTGKRHFHFSVQDPNLEQLVEKIVAAGGKKRMKTPRYYYPGEKPYRMIDMEDPFDNLLEIYATVMS